MIKEVEIRNSMSGIFEIGPYDSAMGQAVN